MIAVILLMAMAMWAMRPFVRCLVVMYSISARRPPLPFRVYRHFFRYEDRVTETTIPTPTRALHVRLYTPVGVTSPPVLVLVHGLVYQGSSNAGVNFWAQRLAEGGFLVVIPDIVSEQNLEMQPAGVEDIGNTVTWAATQYNQPVGVIGVSFSGGLALAAAEHPEYSRYMKLVVSVSGYNSVDRLSHYYLGDHAEGPDGAVYGGPPPDIGPFLIAYQYLNKVLPTEDMLPVKTAMQVWFNQLTQTPTGKQAMASLTTAQRADLAVFADGRSPQLKQQLTEQVSNDRLRLKAISPAGRLRQIGCPVYVLHGLHDLVIPSGEAEWNAAELGPRNDVHLLITVAMSHGVMDQRARRRERMKVGLFLLRALLAMDARHGSFPLFGP